MLNEPMLATTLDDLGTTPVLVTLTRPDGKLILVPVKPLSEEALWQLRRTISRPKPPVKDFQKVNGRVTEILDYDHPDYVRGVEEADQLLAHRVLLAAVQIEIPGETETEKIDALKNRMGGWAWRALLTVSNRLNAVTEEEMGNILRSFRSVDAALPQDDDPPGADAEPMAEIAAP